MDKMRDRMTALKNRGDRSSNNFWKPEEGEQTIRLVAPTDGDPFKAVSYTHLTLPTILRV